MLVAQSGVFTFYKTVPRRIAKLHEIMAKILQ